MRTEKEVREQLERLRSQRKIESPYIESKQIAWHAAKQALEWILEEENHLLTY
ncbi:hypothetical protein KAU25_04885 [Candidatus Bathyarchaeota archaeon]|nr:hypothetical protein [Candidatus Bathyarchaeota archaeon]